MLNFIIGLLFLAVFAVLLWFVRARNGEAVIKSIWAAHSVSLALVCVLMVAGGFLFKTFIE